MKTAYDCIPCFLRQTLNAVRFTSSDEVIHESVLREVLLAVSRMDLKQSPPQMGQTIHRLIREYTGNDDPYRTVKTEFNNYALSLYPGLKEDVENSPDRFETAVRMAIAGNIIDFGVNAVINHEIVQKSIELSLSQKLYGGLAHFKAAVLDAQKILYIGDNAGEIVFDRLLIELLSEKRITYGVRGSPVLNDATIEDARETGMTKVVKVIDNGIDAPGTILEACSKEFRQSFQTADLIIAKGQGNYETLSECDENIYFLLKAKCPVIARHIGCELGDAIVGNKNSFKR